ncbi:MAG: hydrolase [Gammaproteobacteria bacterium]|nr:hydrolase [Gammaproteobacteria bacterium]
MSGAAREQRGFTPAWWLPGPHLQTIWPVLFRPRPRLATRLERLELEDGDFIDIAWLNETAPGPTVLLLHGLEGSIDSHYASGLMKSLGDAGFRVVFMHFRGCSGTPNRLPRGYHSGETGDLSRVVAHVEQASGNPVSAIVGFSLGGNVLLKWLGERREPAGLRRAIAVSVPYRLDQCAARLERGLSRIYRDYLLRKLRASYRRKFRQIESPLRVDPAGLKSFHAFDDRITGPLHGFRGADHYYAESSSRQYLHRIRVETLLLHARDDPFMLAETVPTHAELAPSVRLELSDHGGHVGFVAGGAPWRARYWLDERIVRELSQLR